MRSRLYACVKLSLSLILIAGLTFAAATSASARVNLKLYSVVIADTGDRYPGWDSSDTRVQLDAFDGFTQEQYFDDLPSMFFVVRERYGSVNIDRLQVATEDDGMANAKRAWYFWDDSRMGRGGVPRVLAFVSREDAYAELNDHNGVVMDYGTLMANLDAWDYNLRPRQADVVYWRGWDTWDSTTWTDSWDQRWYGWDWDPNYGWGINSAIYSNPALRTRVISRAPVTVAAPKVVRATVVRPMVVRPRAVNAQLRTRVVNPKVVSPKVVTRPKAMPQRTNQHLFVKPAPQHVNVMSEHRVRAHAKASAGGGRARVNSGGHGGGGKPGKPAKPHKSGTPGKPDKSGKD